MPPEKDDVGALEAARAKLYKPGETSPDVHRPLSVAGDRVLPHAWEDTSPSGPVAPQPKKPLHMATGFLAIAVVFFILSLGVAGYFFYFGGNTVSASKVSLEVEGPTAIASGDTLPITLTITNRNPVAMQNAIIEIEFPENTRDASNTLQAYPRYVENLGEIASGATVTRPVKATLFGGAGQAVTLPISLSYSTAGSNSVFVKKASYDLSISTTPLEVSISSQGETVSGKPLTFMVTVRSNATVPLDNVVLAGAFPFGFQVATSSHPLTNSSFLLGTLTPGASRTITLTGILSGQDSEQRVFRFSVGTAKSATDGALAVTYMTQNATVGITSPFISAALSLNGSATTNVISAGSPQNVSVSYANTLPTNVANVVVAVAITGGAVDYNSISSTRGYYRSLDHTVIFSADTDSSLASLAPGASGIGTFRFATLPAGASSASPSVTFTISISGTRIGQSNVPEAVNASVTKTFKVLTATSLSSSALHSSGPIPNTGPIPPKADQTTTYSVVWSVKNQGSAVAGGTVSATLPSYVTYTGKTSGTGTFSYDSASRKVSWNAGDIAQGATVQGVFQVALTPSTSQINNAPVLAGTASFSGYDRFAGVTVQASASPATTETTGDPGYTHDKGAVQ